jgi:hypothetical protein
MLPGVKETYTLLSVVFRELRGGEGYIEFVHDSGNLNYSKAFHKGVNILESLETFRQAIEASIEGLSTIYDKCNIAFIPGLVLPRRLHKRTGKDEVVSVASWILEIEPTKSEKEELKRKKIIPFVLENEASRKKLAELLDSVLSVLPQDLSNAIHLAYVTGGGVNLVFKFSRPLVKHEIVVVNEKLVDLVKDLRRRYSLPIDESASLYHPQRTCFKNYKYDFYPYILDLGEFGFRAAGGYIDVDDLLSTTVCIQKGSKVEIEQIRKEVEENTNRRARASGFDFKELLDEIRRQADIPSLFGIPHKEYIKYYACHCPFHQPDKNPSFIVYKNPDCQIAIDFHDGRIYDVFSLAQELWGLDFKEAVKTLAEMLSLPVDRDLFFEKIQTEKKKKKEKEEGLARELEIASGVEDFMKEVGLNPDKVEIVRYGEGASEWFVKIEVMSPHGPVSVVLKSNDFANPSSLERNLKIATLNPVISIPGDSVKEKKEFCSVWLSRLIDIANQNNTVKTDDVTMKLLNAMVKELIVDYRNNMLDRFQYKLTGGRGITQDENSYYVGYEFLLSFIKRKGTIGSVSNYAITRTLRKIGIEEVEFEGVLSFKINKGQLGIPDESEIMKFVETVVQEAEQSSDIEAALESSVNESAQTHQEEDEEELFEF